MCGLKTPLPPITPTGPKTGSREGGATGKGSDLEEPAELGLVLASFLRWSPETSEDEGNRMPRACGLGV